MNTIDEVFDELEKKIGVKEITRNDMGTYDILSQEEIDMLLDVIEDIHPVDEDDEDDEDVIYKLEDCTPRRFSFVEVMSWFNRTHKGFSEYPQKISKDTWAENQFIFYVPGSTFKVNRAPLLGIFEEGKEITYRPHIDMHLANGDIVVWTPTTDDMFSEDYYITELNVGDIDNEDL